MDLAQAYRNIIGAQSGNIVRQRQSALKHADTAVYVDFVMFHAAAAEINLVFQCGHATVLYRSAERVGDESRARVDFHNVRKILGSSDQGVGVRKSGQPPGQIETGIDPINIEHVRHYIRSVIELHNVGVEIIEKIDFSVQCRQAVIVAAAGGDRVRINHGTAFRIEFIEGIRRRGADKEKAAAIECQSNWAR